jgi:zinc protease
VWLLVGLVSCAGAPSWEQAPPEVREGPVVDAGRLTRTTLENGLEVIIFEDSRRPEVELAVTVRRGAGIVQPEQAGLATFATELMERGAGDRDALALAQAVDELGASLGVSSSWDASGVSVGGLSRDLEALLDLLADVVLRPRFDSDEADKVRSELLAALERSKDQPGSLARWQLAEVLYPDHAYGAPAEGLPETVSKLGPEHARAFHAGIFVARNAIFSAAGDVDAATLLPRVRELFGSWPGGEPPPPAAETPQTTPPERRSVVVDGPDRGQGRVVWGVEGLARTDPERLSAHLMNAALGGGGFISRLMTRLRADEGLTYGVGSGFSLRRRPGPFVVSTSTRVPEVRRVVDLALAEVERMQSEPPDAQEFRDMQTLLAGRFALGLETSAAITDALVELDVAGLPPDSLDTYRTRIRQQTTEDVARAARDRLHPERMAIIVVGPADAVVPQLEDLGPVEVVSR